MSSPIESRATGAAPVNGVDEALAVEQPAVSGVEQGKTFATLRARAALIGYSLGTITETDGLCFYLLSRWGMTRTLPDLAAVASFLRQVGAPE